MKFSVLIIILFLSQILSGQSIEGWIINQANGKSIVGASIEILELGIGEISNKDGYFKFENVEKGICELKISSVSFRTKIERVLVDLNKTNTIYIELQENIFDLPQIVVESITMTGGLSGVHKTLGSAHYIDQKEIQKFSYSDINRTLRNIPGVNIQEEDGYGLRPNIGLRATGSERSSKITVMEDGILAAPAPYSAPAAYYFPSIGRMEAIEIMKGSTQIKYGPFTTGGAINLISTPLPSEFGGHADFIAGNNAYRMLHANLGNAHDNFAYLVETLQYSSDGFKDLDDGGNTGFNKEDYLAKFRLHTNPEASIYQSLTFKIGQAKETSNETYLGLTDEDFKITPIRRYAGSQKDLMKTEQKQLSLTHFTQLSQSFDVQTTIYRNEFSRNWYKLDKVNDLSISRILESPDLYKNELQIIKGEKNGLESMLVKANNRSYFSRGIQTNVIFHRVDGDFHHKLDLSIRIHQDQIDRFQWADGYDMDSGIMKLSNTGRPGTESNRIETANAISSYIQYKLDWKNWTIYPGMRNEHIQIEREDYGKNDPERSGTDISSRSNQTSIWIPGLALSYEFSDFTRFFAGVHKGFAPPGSKEGTLPEESWNYELGWRTGDQYFKAQIVGYFNDYLNLLGSDLAASGGTGSQDLFNGGEARAIGLEAELSYDLLRGMNSSMALPISIAYTYTYTAFDNTFESEFEAWGEVEVGDFLPYTPRNQFSVSLSLEHPRLFFDINARHSSAMLTEAGHFDDQKIGRTEVAFTLDTAINYRLTNEISAFVNVNNLTNNIYVVSRRPAGVRPNLPRSFNVGLKANF